MFELNDLLVKCGIDPTKVMVMRHRPTEVPLRKALPWLAAEHHQLYNAYQSHHGEAVEKALPRASHLVSFIGHEPARALFVGIYAVGTSRPVSIEEYWAMEWNKALGKLGTKGPGDRPVSRWFDLTLTEHLQGWKGRLVIAWPGGERGWWRWADRNVMSVDAIHKDSVLVRSMPPWNELVLDWAQLKTLPSSWRLAIGQWRGIYLILDKASGKSYVGSAYGADNILGRWLAYGATGDGGNEGLRGLDPANFQFAVLERVSPDMLPDDVIHLEGTWKKRLGTKDFGLNKN